ncbi:MAG: AAA family ATPase [Bacteroidetes bacterium]|nr:AAA family ATPase [Bacteroidota bacterium]
MFVTGSNSRLLSGELATNLSGRCIVFEIMPFSYTEYLGLNTLENQKKHLSLLNPDPRIHCNDFIRLPE